MVEQGPLSIAVVGGGIAGLTLTVALLTRCPSIQVTLYESAAAFGDIGAGVGFSPTMVRTMGLIDPRIEAAFIKCNKGNVVTDPPVWFTARLGDERKKNVQLGEELFTIPGREGPNGGVHRAQFLDELVKLIPEGVAQFKKRVLDITEATDGSGDAMLHFADGSTAQHSAVLGCDGIKSRVRQVVLDDVPEAKAVFSGKYAYRGLFPMTKAVEILGEEIPRTPQMWLGYHAHILTFPIANGTLFNVVAFASRLSWEDSNWVVQTSRDEMLEDFKDFIPAARKIIESMQKPDIWALFYHLPAVTYHVTKPSICLVGDAAHASTPQQGAGAGMCIEDVYVLSELLSQCHEKEQLTKAFHAYDAVRRPRSQRLVATSKEAGKLWQFEGEGVGDNLEALRSNALSRMDWIWDYEISGDLETARRMMDTSLTKTP